MVNTPLDPEAVPANADLLAVSTRYGYVVVGYPDGKILRIESTAVNGRPVVHIARSTNTSPGV